MEKKRKLRTVPFIEFLLLVAFGEAAYISTLFAIPVGTTILFVIGFVYVLLHVLFGPLDWYLIYKLYKKAAKKEE